jgi:hypothetical protein
MQLHTYFGRLLSGLLPICFFISTHAQTLVTAQPVTGTPIAGEYYHPTSITLGNGFHFVAAPGSTLHYYISGCVPLAATPSSNQNYVVTYTPRKEFTGVTDLSGKQNCEVMQTIAYFDGLGRPLQTVQVKGNPDGTRDVIMPVAYDQFGREAIKYLPYTTASGTPGSYRADALSGKRNSRFLSCKCDH